MRAGPPALTALLFACAPRSNPATTGLSVGDIPDTTTTTGPETITNSDSDTATTSTTSSTTEASGAASGYPKDDLGVPDMGDVTPACNGKIDIIFVIPMAGNEYFDAAMPSSLADFAATMSTTLADFDLHVMVLDAGGAWGSPLCPKDKCPADGPCPALADPSFPCWALHEEGALTKCDDTRGAGVTFPAGPGASNVRCPVPDGRRFLSSGDPDFAETFSCIATIGGKTESTCGGESLMRAVSADLDHGCNAGFLREDALLLAFLISVNDYSDYSPPVWADVVLEAKGDDHDKVVVMTVAPDQSAPNPLCPGIPQEEPSRPHQFSMLFEHGLQGSVCAPEYGPYFDEAASLAAELCDAGPQG